MSYRRGFQRLYAVLAVGWVIAAVAVSVRHEALHRWKVEGMVYQFPGDFSNDQMREVLVNQGIVKAEVSDPVRLYAESWWEAASSLRFREWSWIFGLSAIPIAIVYALCFYVGPWVYRGFSGQLKSA
jgi:hypothetical protein